MPSGNSWSQVTHRYFISDSFVSSRTSPIRTVWAESRIRSLAAQLRFALVLVASVLGSSSIGLEEEQANLLCQSAHRLCNRLEPSSFLETIPVLLRQVRYSPANGVRRRRFDFPD